MISREHIALDHDRLYPGARQEGGRGRASRAPPITRTCGSTFQSRNQQRDDHREERSFKAWCRPSCQSCRGAVILSASTLIDFSSLDTTTHRRDSPATTFRSRISGLFPSDHETLVPVLRIEGLQSLVLRRVAALAGHVPNQCDSAFEAGQRSGCAVERGHSEVVEARRRERCGGKKKQDRGRSFMSRSYTTSGSSRLLPCPNASRHVQQAIVAVAGGRRVLHGVAGHHDSEHRRARHRGRRSRWRR